VLVHREEVAERVHDSGARMAVATAQCSAQILCVIQGSSSCIMLYGNWPIHRYHRRLSHRIHSMALASERHFR